MTNAYEDTDLHGRQIEPTVVSLAEWLDNDDTGIEEYTEVSAEAGHVHTRWRITDISGASWAMRKLRRARLKIRANAQAAQVERDRVSRWLDAVNLPLVRDAETFEELLREWHVRTLRDEEGVDVYAGAVDKERWKKVRTKSVKLTTGEVGARRGSGSFSAVGDVAVPWLATHAPEMLTWHPTVGATKLEECVEHGFARVGDDGRYYARLGVDTVDVAHVEAAMAALAPDDDGNSPEPYKVADTFGFLACSVVAAQHPGTVLTLTQELGEPPVCTAWVPIPGVQRVGEGVVTITPKPDLTED